MSKRSEHIILLIQSMYHDLKNPRNDGWMQEQMLKDLIEIEDAILSLELKKENLRFRKESVDIIENIDDVV